MPAIRDRGERGFALALVVFLLFAAAVAGATGYQIVSSEASLAEGNESQHEALAVANAGMQRYIGEHIGIPGSSTYAVGDGSVTVTSKKLAKLNDSTDLYLLTAVGSVTDPRYPTSPATRTAYQYVNLNRRPVKRRAAFWTIESQLTMQNPGGSTINGNQNAADVKTNCPAGDTLNLTSVYGFVAATPASQGGGGDPPTGSPSASTGSTYANAAAVISAAAVRWSVLKDATFPIPYDGTWPNFSSIPSDSFPVIRVNGNYSLDRNGRGALIVTGAFTNGGAYTWKGIILAGSVATSGLTRNSGSAANIQGMVVTGLNGTANNNPLQLQRFDVQMYTCYVRKANLALAYLSPVSRSLWTY